MTRIKALNPEPERTFEEKKIAFEHNAHMNRKHFVALNVTTNPAADKFDAEIHLDKSKFGQLAYDFDGNFATSREELALWMKCKHAAQLLRVPEDKLYGLRAEEVEEAFRREYALCGTNRQREEVSAAADVLFGYIETDVAKERTKDHYADTIIKAKKEIAVELEKSKQNSRNMMYTGLGIGHFAITAFFAASIVAMFHYIKRNDAEMAVIKARRHFSHAMSMPSNEEPGPEYITRYRDTPTSLDEHMAAPHPEITDPSHRKILLESDDDMRREETLLATMTSDVATDAAVRQRKKEETEELRKQLKHFSPLQVMDSVVATVPPPGLREIRREQQHQQQQQQHHNNSA
jgi:hypothetical protein